VPESIGTGYRLLVQTDSPEGVVGQTLSASFEITTLSSVPAGTSNTTLFLGVGPNPWTQSTTLRSSPPEAMEARLEISDVRGRLVRALASGRLEAGRHSVDWDGTDAQGAPVAAGAYLYRFSAGTVRASGRLMLVR
jgi:flagellar hook assembly protein FlgD